MDTHMLYVDTGLIGTHRFMDTHIWSTGTNRVYGDTGFTVTHGL